MRPTGPRLATFVAVLALCLAPPAGARPRAAPAMIYDIIENVAPGSLGNDLKTKLEALATLKGVPIAPTAGGITSTVTVYKGLPAAIYAAIEQNPLPGFGIDWDRVLTQARRQDKRDNLAYLVGDYFARGTDPVVLEIQTKLFAEAALQWIDGLWLMGGFVYGAAEPDRSIEIVKQQIARGQDTYEAQLLLRFPVNEEDQGLT